MESCLADGGAAVSAISVYELPAGVSSDRHVAQRMELVSLTTVIALTSEIAARAAALYTSLRSDGITLDNEDIIIAATALELAVPVLTLDAGHFRKVAGLATV